MGRKWASDAEKQAFFISKKVDKAVRDHEMLAPGDRVLVGVSGGKDSLSLLRLLVYRVKYSPVKYELFAAHIRGDARGAVTTVSQELIDWCAGEGVPLHIEDLHLPEDEPLPMNCERCGRNRRRTLFEVADKLGCNKLALGHTLEDFAHTALMNLFSNGRLETMAHKRTYFGGRFVLVRPLAYVREGDIIRFASTCELPIMKTDCPLAFTSDRQSARNLMQQVSKDFRSASLNIVKAAVAIGPHEPDPRDQN